MPLFEDKHLTSYRNCESLLCKSSWSLLWRSMIFLDFGWIIVAHLYAPSVLSRHHNIGLQTDKNVFKSLKPASFESHVPCRGDAPSCISQMEMQYLLYSTECMLPTDLISQCIILTIIPQDLRFEAFHRN